ncbi:hypothetical protein GWK08_15390 [Leptobacterium flavescens]|uniref:Nuclear transport factor 2 family protein n=1 Tax=Leptobacterium flavescens TaxID=472055 RepID=A0A6P0USN9_9FLAO|nr:hypothetical protein [Leptobacterium flavescens]NER14839.1 hypothetical protein [Leptobacterium flavescens]
MKTILKLSFCFILVLNTNNADAQDKNTDFSEIDPLINTLYDVISGPAGDRDWDLFKSLFHPNATMGSIRLSQDGKREFIYFDVNGYIERSGAFFKDNGFYEEEIGREVKIYGGVAQVFTAYQFKLNDDPKVAQRGINCIQLVFSKGRWYITNIVWEGESEANPLPEAMVKNK